MTHESDAPQSPTPPKRGYLRSKWQAWRNFERLIVIVVIAAIIVFGTIWHISY